MSFDTTDFDLIVMGAGIAGMVSAVKAAELGLRVVVLEQGKEDDYLCNTRLTSGIFHCAMQSASVEPKQLYKKILENTSHRADTELAHTVANEALESIRWLQSNGVRFIKGAMPHYEFILSPPTLFHQNKGWQRKGGDVLLNLLERKLISLGSFLLRNQKVTSMSRPKQDSLIVEAVTSEGAINHFKAPHVVIADGGFQSNHSLLSQGISFQPEKLFQRNAKQSHGDGMLMAQSMGAQIELNQGFYGHLLSRDAFSNDQLWPNPWMDPLATAGIVVTSKGVRFADEGVGGIFLANQLARSNDPLDAFIIIDESAWNARGRINMQSPNPKLIEVGGIHFCSNSLKELALKAGIEFNALNATIDSHNLAIASGDFSKLLPTRTTHPHQPMPIVGKPLYAFPVCAAITYTFGGIKTNSSGEVLSTENLSIPGLFAVGSCTTGLEGGDSAGYVGGLIKSTVFGIKAAIKIKHQQTQHSKHATTHSE